MPLPYARHIARLGTFVALVFLLAACALLLTGMAAATPAHGARNLFAQLAVQQAELTAADGSAGDMLGFSVALSGDTALVGARYKTVGGQAQAGAAYVFTRTGAVWKQQAELTAGDAAAGAQFGRSVSIVGDTALIGAGGSTVGGQAQAGAAYVFTRTGTVWKEQAELTAGDAAAGAQFGFSVALSGSTALVGAWGTNVAQRTHAGAAYVFVNSGANWSEQAELTAGDGAGGDFLGRSVAISGDTALVGALGKAVAGQDKVGAAYVFVRSGAAWSEQAELNAAYPAPDLEFGCGVAISGGTALVGAYHGLVAGHALAGAAYVFVRTGGGWSEQAQLTAVDPVNHAKLGRSVALSGDTALLGVGGPEAEAAYVFKRAGTGWSEQTELTASDAAPGDQFGWSVALSGATALVGANLKDVNGEGEVGAAYVEMLPCTITPAVVGGHGALDPHVPQTHAWGSTPTFTFTPDLGYHVAALELDGVPVSMTGADSYAFAPLTADHTLSVSFANDEFTVTAGVAGGHGSVNPSGPQTYPWGSTPSFSFSPETGYQVSAVTLDGVSLTPLPGAAYVFPALSADHLLSVSFSAVPGNAPSCTLGGWHAGWQRRPVRLTFSGHPGPYGIVVAATEYTLGAGPWQQGGAVTVRAQGRTRVAYRALDAGGNLGAVKVCVVALDARRPRLEARPAFGPAGGSFVLRYRVLDALPGCGQARVRLTLRAAAGQTLARATARWAPIGGWRSLRVSAAYLAPGLYTAVLRATDLAGNRQCGSTRVRVRVW